jgi:arginine exporter protein ArgO
MFLMQPITCQNLFEINRNHRNNMSIVATGIADIIMLVATVVGYCAFAGLVPPCYLKLRLTYLKIEAR